MSGVTMDLDTKRDELVTYFESPLELDALLKRESSIKKFTTVSNKIRNYIQNDQDLWSLIPEISSTSFDKYIDEISSILSFEQPKKVASIFNYIKLVVYFTKMYPDFMKAYRSKWDSNFATFLVELKRDPSSFNKNIVRVTVELYLVGFDMFFECLDRLFNQIRCSCELKYSTLFIFMHKIISRVDFSKFRRCLKLKSSYEDLTSIFKVTINKALAEKRDQYFAVLKKQRHVFETKGDLTSSQSELLMNLYRQHNDCLDVYAEICSLDGFSLDKSKFTIEAPIVEEGRIVFYDQSLIPDDDMVYFDNQEELEFYRSLELPDCMSGLSYNSPQEAIDCFLKSNSINESDNVARYFVDRFVNEWLAEGIVERILDVSKYRSDLIPTIARFFAVMDNHHECLSALAKKSIIGQAYFLLSKKAPLASMRSRIGFIIAEFTKFGVMNQSETFMILRKGCDDTDSFNIEFMIRILNGCGKYLFRHPFSRRRMEHLFRILRSNYSRLSLAESNSVESTICHIVGVEQVPSSRPETLESLYLTHSLHSADHADLPTIVALYFKCFGAQFVAEHIAFCRCLSYLEFDRTDLLFMSIEEKEYFLLVECLLTYMYAEIGKFPYIDRQLIKRFVDLMVHEVGKGRLSNTELTESLDFLFNRVHHDDPTDWSNFKNCALSGLSCEPSKKPATTGVSLLASSESSNTEPKLPEDQVDKSIDDLIEALSAGALNEKKSMRNREESISYIGSPTKSESTNLKILLRSNRGKKSGDLRKIS